MENDGQARKWARRSTDASFNTAFVCVRVVGRATRTTAGNHSQRPRSGEKGSSRSGLVVERPESTGGTVDPRRNCGSVEDACQYGRSHPQTFCDPRRSAGLESKGSDDAAHSVQTRWPGRSHLGGGLLQCGSRGPDALDVAFVGRRIGQTPDRDIHRHRNGTAGAEKNQLQPWRKVCWCVPERDAARFVAQMEDILDVYEANHPDDEPLICMDEAAKELHDSVREPIPMTPGHPAKEDYHYQRQGTAAVFLFFNPLQGRRRVSARDSRTRIDWAEEVRCLLDEDYPQARKITLVCDNLNTHGIASLYQAFPPAEAHRLARRL